MFEQTADPDARAAAVAALGASGSADPEQRRGLRALVNADPDPRVRAVALAALVRVERPRAAASAWRAASQDVDAAVRRRAAEVAPQLGVAIGERWLLALLRDASALVAEAAAFALGERGRASATAVRVLGRTVTDHADPLVREAAVAALGAIGDPAGLPAVLRACDDKPAVRRRAVLALAAFDGPEVEARLLAALDDADWQTRQGAEDLLREPLSERPASP
jgi:HEAT repeat protein